MIHKYCLFKMLSEPSYEYNTVYKNFKIGKNFPLYSNIK